MFHSILHFVYHVIVFNFYLRKIVLQEVITYDYELTHLEDIEAKLNNTNINFTNGSIS
jgi:hypothetical protein